MANLVQDFMFNNGDANNPIIYRPVAVEMGGNEQLDPLARPTTGQMYPEGIE